MAADRDAAANSGYVRYCERLLNGDCDDTDRCRADGCRWIEQPPAAKIRACAEDIAKHHPAGNLTIEEARAKITRAVRTGRMASEVQANSKDSQNRDLAE